MNWINQSAPERRVHVAKPWLIPRKRVQVESRKRTAWEIAEQERSRRFIDQLYRESEHTGDHNTA